ncbi:hypothetical protein [Dokdonella koreensis]|uniref:Uncharacterized protein n=1 Tax=Dokdonella koreensis DS-123 TaxID=1300342 RepID=A0A167G893_9GAMM|nr:hypothetical protein [Dokdonella koreensis]ANB16253.1 Hypothetical protein I596_214 [Dokdonella koreensis DS-123]
MGWQDRCIAAVLLVYGLGGIALLIYLATVVPLPAGYLAASAALSGVALAAGVGSLRNRRWARWLGALFFLVQVAQAALPESGSSVLLGLHFTVSVSGVQGGSVAIDPFAVLLLAWSLVRLVRTRARPAAPPALSELPTASAARDGGGMGHQKRNTPETPSRLE